MKATIIAALILASCSASKKPQEPEAPVDNSACESACDHWESLGCDISEADEEGNTCDEVCIETQAGGLVDLEPEKAADSDECP